MAKFQYHGIVGVRVPVYGPEAAVTAALFHDTKTGGKRPGRYLLVTLDEYEMAEEIPELRERVFRGQRIPVAALLEACADLTLARIDMVTGENKEYEGFPFPHFPIVSSLDPAKRAIFINDQLAKLAQSRKVVENYDIAENNTQPRFQFAAPVWAEVVYDGKATQEIVGLFQLIVRSFRS